MVHRTLFCAALALALLWALVPGGLSETNGTDGPDRVIFLRMSTCGPVDSEDVQAPNADMILVSSGGRWGLIDAGFRWEDTVTDSDGTVYDVPAFTLSEDGTRSYTALSCQVPGMNGRDAAKYLHDVLGVERLDFILATHSHSDHVGGIPELAASAFADAEGNPRFLVDAQTVYLYKAYRAVSPREDDLGAEKRPDSWHNQAFASAALAAMEARGARTAEVSRDLTFSRAAKEAPDAETLTADIREAGTLQNVVFRPGDPADPFDDRLSFAFGNFTVHLYNLYAVDGAQSENVNSIAAVITDGHSRLFTAGDLDAEWFTEQKIVRAVAADFGGMDLIKAGHHGNRGSNTRFLLDALRPRFMVVSRWYNVAEGGRDGFSPAVYYARDCMQYTEAVYETSLSPRGIAAEFGTDGIVCLLLEEDGSLSTDVTSCLHPSAYVDGWYAWPMQHQTGPGVDYLFCSDGRFLTGWQKISGSRTAEGGEAGDWYYFDGQGLMQVGWQTLDGNTYYLLPEARSGQPMGSRVTGWQWIDGKIYVFDDSGVLIE